MRGCAVRRIWKCLKVHHHLYLNSLGCKLRDPQLADLGLDLNHSTARMAKPAIIPIEPSEEEDISRTPLWDPSGAAAAGKRGSKGKERDLSDGLGKFTELVESPVHSSYPPTNEEEEESRRVQEVRFFEPSRRRQKAHRG